MKKKGARNPQQEIGECSEPFRIRLPGFITAEDVGLGDVLKRVTYAFGVKPCSGCERRAAALSRWLVFSGGHAK
jgi:hypothetical protein